MHGLAPNCHLAFVFITDLTKVICIVLKSASSVLFVASFDVNECAVPIIELVGHEDVVQAVVFDPQCQFLVSGSTDCTFRVWG
jgi:WD40 repeat protein